jgi:hypothetical protein
LRKVGGAFFQTRVRTPRIVRSSISNGEPGRVSAALASASEMAGNAFAPAISFSLIPACAGTASAERQ